MQNVAGSRVRAKGNQLGRTGLALFGGVIVAAAISIQLKDSRPAWLGSLAVVGALLLLQWRYIERAVPWLQGARGEKEVGGLLAALEAEGFQIIHSLKFGRGDIDHVAIGPPGVFVIDTKAWSARPRLAGQKLFVGSRDETSQLNRLIAQAAHVRRGLGPELRSIWVDPILASAKTVPYGGCRRARGVTVLAAEDLVGFLRSRPPKLNQEQITVAYEHLVAR